MSASGESGADPSIVCRGLSVHFDDRSALFEIDLQFSPGETVSLVGPNGAGKSTLLKVLAGLLPLSHGSATFHGGAISGPTDEITYVPQRTSVDWSFPVSVLDVVMMAIGKKRSRFRPFSRHDADLAREALDRTGMGRFASVQIGQLSGGQQQRVFLARALLQSGEVYLLDEPFAGVDVPTQELLVALFDGLRRAGKTIIYASHDLAQAARTSDRIVLLNRSLVASGPPSIVMTAENLRRAFGGQAVVPVDSGHILFDAPP